MGTSEPERLPASELRQGDFIDHYEVDGRDVGGEVVAIDRTAAGYLLLRLANEPPQFVRVHDDYEFEVWR